MPTVKKRLRKRKKRRKSKTKRKHIPDDLRRIIRAEFKKKSMKATVIYKKDRISKSSFWRIIRERKWPEIKKFKRNRNSSLCEQAQDMAKILCFAPNITNMQLTARKVCAYMQISAEKCACTKCAEFTATRRKKDRYVMSLMHFRDKGYRKIA